LSTDNLLHQKFAICCLSEFCLKFAVSGKKLQLPAAYFFKGQRCCLSTSAIFTGYGQKLPHHSPWTWIPKLRPTNKHLISSTVGNVQHFVHIDDLLSRLAVWLSTTPLDWVDLLPVGECHRFNSCNDIAHQRTCPKTRQHLFPLLLVIQNLHRIKHFKYLVFYTLAQSKLLSAYFQDCVRSTIQKKFVIDLLIDFIDACDLVA